MKEKKTPNCNIAYLLAILLSKLNLSSGFQPKKVVLPDLAILQL